MRLYITLIIVLLIISCTSNNTDNKDTSQIYHLTIEDSPGRFEGRKVILKISDTYESGVPKEMSYVIEDTVLMIHLLESGFISKKQTFIKDQLVDETIIDISDWGNSKLYNVKSITAENFNDTLTISVIDDSYIWFDEYVSWKSDYLIWLNREKLSLTDNIRIKFFQEGKEIEHEYLYVRDEIDKLFTSYANNSRYDSISSIILSVFNPTDLMNLRNANHYINENLGDYKVDFVQLFYDLSICEKNCIAEMRLRLIGEMLQGVKLEDFWSDKKVDADEFIIRLNLIFEVMNMTKI